MRTEQKKAWGESKRDIKEKKMRVLTGDLVRGGEATIQKEKKDNNKK